jgi:hypothetical protein
MPVDEESTKFFVYFSKVLSDVIMSIPIASLVPVPLLNPNWSFPSTY